jgi:hypothetical protein
MRESGLQYEQKPASIRKSVRGNATGNDIEIPLTLFSGFRRLLLKPKTDLSLKDISALLTKINKK